MPATNFPDGVVIGGTRTATVDGQRSAAIADIDSSTVDATYGAQEQAVLADLRTKVDAILAALRKVGIIEE